MKKILIAFIAIIAIVCQTNAQDIKGDWTTNAPTTKCFCCDNSIYNLPNVPPITGPTAIACGASATFTTTSCPGATIVWAITPAIPFTGQGTSSITINPVYASSSYTISVTIRCGNKIVKNQIVVKIQEQQNCSPNFLISLQEMPNGLYQVVTTPSTTAGTVHYWILQEVASCPSGAVTGTASGWNLFVSATGVPSTSNPAITTGPSGYGYQYAGLGKGKCYRLYHYVQCCGQWKVQTKCFCLMSTLRAKMSDAELGSSTTTKDLRYDELPAELKNRVKQ